MTVQIQRAIVKGNIAGVVQTRNMFVAELIPVAPETDQQIWQEYLIPLWTDIHGVLASTFHITSVELQNWFGGHWEPSEEYTWTFSGIGAGEAYNNQVAAVLIGKGLGRRVMGRKFISPLDEVNVASNELTAGALVLMASMAVDYVSPITTAGGSVLQPGIIDKNGAFKMFVSGFVSAVLGTIRRRKVGRGI